MIADSFGKKRPHKQVSPLIAALVWRWEKWKSIITSKAPLVTKETAKASLSLVQMDNSKMLKALPGFVYVPLQQTIARICKNLPQAQNPS